MHVYIYTYIYQQSYSVSSLALHGCTLAEATRTHLTSPCNAAAKTQHLRCPICFCSEASNTMGILN